MSFLCSHILKSPCFQTLSDQNSNPFTCHLWPDGRSISTLAQWKASKNCCIVALRNHCIVAFRKKNMHSWNSSFGQSNPQFTLVPNEVANMHICWTQYSLFQPTPFLKLSDKTGAKKTGCTMKSKCVGGLDGASSSAIISESFVTCCRHWT